ncbi:oligopeptidase B Serine peptidase. MEROPS family S09A [Rhizobiales bacterium GAS113]|nr:oligopeptidase B Serine peptidase. MEROPS family S09A [Rhizobiales bacterium GAS113]
MNAPTALPAVSAPICATKPHKATNHGIVIHDDYAWLKAPNWQEVLKDAGALPADIGAHLEAENAYADACLAPLQPLIETLTAELRGRLEDEDTTAPVPDGPYLYYRRWRSGSQHPCLVRRKRAGGQEEEPEEELLIDGESLAAGRGFFQLGPASHSPDHRLIAYAVDEAGSEFFTIRVRDLARNRDLPDTVANTRADAVLNARGDPVVWSGDGSSFFYVRLDDNHRARTLWRHVIGAPASSDSLVFEERAQGWFVSVHREREGRHASIAVRDHETSEAFILDLDRPEAPPVLVAARQAGIRYEIEIGRDRLFIRTNRDGAEDFKIVEAPLSAPGPAEWRDIVPHRPGVMVLQHAIFARHLVWLEREDGLPRLLIRALASSLEHAVTFEEEAFALSLDAGEEFDTDILRFTISTPARPAETYDYDMVSRERVLVKRQLVPSGHDPDAYVVRRLHADAPDGETIPVTVLHRRDLVLDGRAPCLLYAYGAYGSSVPAQFIAHRLSLVDRGMIYAIAHIRGGTEKGWSWYLNGKRALKENGFSDYLSVARMLIAERYTSAGRIVANGRSAGGMVMGVVANRAPELFAGIVTEVPFVDVLTTMLDANLPLTPPEWPEWGNPIESESDFRTILAYSPIDNIKPRHYPAILAIAGLTDPRVTYWEPAKWVAKLRANSRSGRPILLRTDMSGGHMGAPGRFDRLSEFALTYAFALSVDGLAVVQN